ncbi:MAG: hypothetical protein PHW04_16520 [Candidatus Wallbacteria bacterium]|nr:hypothetical protein [Candidatus Wallbacteria bacterium]
MKTLTVVLLLICISSAFADYQKAQSLYQDSIKMLEAGDVAKAFDTYQAAVSCDNSILTLKNQVLAEFQLKKMEKETSLINLAKAYFICGNYLKTSGFVKKIFILFPSTSKEYWEASALQDQVNRIERDQIQEKPGEAREKYVKNSEVEFAKENKQEFFRSSSKERGSNKDRSSSRENYSSNN